MARVRKMTGKFKVHNYVNDYIIRNDLNLFFPQSKGIEKYWISVRIHNENY